MPRTLPSALRNQAAGDDRLTEHRLLAAARPAPSRRAPAIARRPAGSRQAQPGAEQKDEARLAVPDRRPAAGRRGGCSVTRSAARAAQPQAVEPAAALQAGSPPGQRSNRRDARAASGSGRTAVQHRRGDAEQRQCRDAADSATRRARSRAGITESTAASGSSGNRPQAAHRRVHARAQLRLRPCSRLRPEPLRPAEPAPGKAAGCNAAAWSAPVRERPRQARSMPGGSAAPALDAGASRATRAGARNSEPGQKRQRREQQVIERRRAVRLLRTGPALARRSWPSRVARKRPSVACSIAISHGATITAISARPVSGRKPAQPARIAGRRSPGSRRSRSPAPGRTGPLSRIAAVSRQPEHQRRSASPTGSRRRGRA